MRFGIVIALALIISALKPWIIRGESESGAIKPVAKSSLPEMSEPETDPITMLFSESGKKPPSIRIISTLLGSPPTAIIDFNGMRHHIGEGDTVYGVVVDSIGRGVVILRKGHEINRIHM